MSVEPYDEPAIAAGDAIIRRIHPVHHIVFDHSRNCYRISSKAYAPSSGPDAGMSVDIETLIVKAGIDPKDFVTTPVFTGSVAFAASDIRSQGLRIGYDPVVENPYHGEVWGQSQANRFTSSQKRELATAAKWYVAIAGVQLV